MASDLGLHCLSMSSKEDARRIDKLVKFHANQMSMCLDPHLN